MRRDLVVCALLGAALPFAVVAALVLLYVLGWIG